MLRVFFKEPASSGFARRPVGAVRFADKMEAKMEKVSLIGKVLRTI